MPHPIAEDVILHMLACPVCHASLERIDSETVRCSGCGMRYPIRDGLPVLRPDVTQ